MIRAGSILLTLWVLLLSPGLCLAGAIEHPCPDCPQGFSCEHEESCPTDPCVEMIPQSAPGLDLGNAACAVVLSPAPDPSFRHGVPVPLPAVEPAGLRGNLPHPESDRPLRI